MKVVAFLGSPRRDGNSEMLLNEALKPVREGGHELKVFVLNEMNITPCQNCGGCDETGECIVEDEMTAVYGAIRQAERIIISSPIFFFGISAQTKAMIDRCQAFWCEKYLLKKPIPEGPHGRKGLFITVGGMKKDIGVTCSEATVKAFFRTVSVPEHRTLGYLGVDAQGAIREHPTALGEVLEAARELLK